MRGEKGEIFGHGRGRGARPKFGPDIRYRAPYKARSWTPLPSPRPRLRASEDTFSVGKGGTQDTLSPGKGGVDDTFDGNPPSRPRKLRPGRAATAGARRPGRRARRTVLAPDRS